MSHLILGLDEVGRGPIAGPLVIGACVLPPRYLKNGREDPKQDWQNDLTDSKKLSESRRDKLAPVIEEKCLSFGLGWVPAEELDALGISEGLRTAARRAVEDLVKNFPKVDFSEIIIDGDLNFLKGTKYEHLVTTVVKADLKIKEVSAASIIAKVARDHYMISVAGMQYPKYEFARHKGYGTKVHWERFSKNGPCPEHRWIISRISKTCPTRPLEFTTSATEKVPEGERFVPSEYFSKNRPTGVYKKPKKNPTAVGNAAERKIAELLISKNHKIISRNYKRKRYEIDIVSATSEHIYFTEVKYRSNPNSGSPAEAITPKKLEQMRYSAERFMDVLSKMMYRPVEDLPSPILAVGTVDKSGKTDWFELKEE